MLAVIGVIALIGLVYFLSRKPEEVAEARLVEAAPEMEIAVATQKVIKEEAIAKVAPEIIAEVQTEALSADRPITIEEAKEMSDAIAEAVGVPITDPAPAQAVYAETGVVPAGHWSPPSYGLASRYPGTYRAGYIDGQRSLRGEPPIGRSVLYEDVSEDEAKAYWLGYREGREAR